PGLARGRPRSPPFGGYGADPRAYQPDCVTPARKVGRLTGENSPALKVDACIRRLRVRGLLTCTTTNHPCVITVTVGENRVAPKGTVAGKRRWRRKNSRIHHRTGRSRPGGIRCRFERVEHNRDRWRSDRQRPIDVTDRSFLRSFVAEMFSIAR